MLYCYSACFCFFFYFLCFDPDILHYFIRSVLCNITPYHITVKIWISGKFCQCQKAWCHKQSKIMTVARKELTKYCRCRFIDLLICHNIATVVDALIITCKMKVLLKIGFENQICGMLCEQRHIPIDVRHGWQDSVFFRDNRTILVYFWIHSP